MLGPSQAPANQRGENLLALRAALHGFVEATVGRATERKLIKTAGRWGSLGFGNQLKLIVLALSKFAAPGHGTNTEGTPVVNDDFQRRSPVDPDFAQGRNASRAAISSVISMQRRRAGEKS